MLLLLAGCTFSFEGPPLVQEMALADLDGDGDLDAYLTINPDGEPYQHPDAVLLNEGGGRFVDSGQQIGNMNSFSVALGDLNEDGRVDAVAGNQVYLNYGRELFGRGSYGLMPLSDGAFRWDVALADLDGDGRLDVFGAGCCGGAVASPTPQPLYADDMVWLNQGFGRFRSSGQTLAPTGSNAVALGDLDGDGFVDAFIAGGLSTRADGSTTRETPNTVWFNDGTGHFRQSGQQLGQAESLAVALGDIDGDGDLDAVAGNRGRDRLWLNDGRGRFQPGPQRLDEGETRYLFLQDVDGDGDLDLFAGGRRGARVWRNDGLGHFQRSRQGIDYDDAAAVLGDVTGDGLPDVLVADVVGYRVWQGEGNGHFSKGERILVRDEGGR